MKPRAPVTNTLMCCMAPGSSDDTFSFQATSLSLSSRATSSQLMVQPPGIGATCIPLEVITTFGSAITCSSTMTHERHGLNLQAQ